MTATAPVPRVALRPEEAADEGGGQGHREGPPAPAEGAGEGGQKPAQRGTGP